jgi:hypothetical protein
MAEKKKITVVKQKRPKKPKKSKKARKAKKAKKGKKGKGQYSSAFPTNRQIDSNQYWQLRAEIAGAESRVRTSLKDRQEDEKKAEKKVTKLETEVRGVAAAQQTPQVVINTVGTPAVNEYDLGEDASRSRAERRGSSARTPEPRRSRSLSPSGLSRSASSALSPEDYTDRASHLRPTRSPRSPSPVGLAVAGMPGRVTSAEQDELLARNRQAVGAAADILAERERKQSEIGARIPARERPRQATPAGARKSGGGGAAQVGVVTRVLPPKPDEAEGPAQRAKGNTIPLSAGAGDRTRAALSDRRA